MGPVTQTITFRPDARDEQAIALIMATDGVNRSEAIRRALAEAQAARRRAAVRKEALALGGDAEDREEAQRVLSDMEKLRAW